MRIVLSLMSRLTIYVTSILRGSRKRGREVNYKFTIPGRLPGINEYTQACRSNPFVGSKMKKDAEKAVMCATNIGLMIDRPVFIYYRFYEKNKRRDLDNISGFAHTKRTFHSTFAWRSGNRAEYTHSMPSVSF